MSKAKAKKKSTAKTKLFNIRLTEEKHRDFKKFADEVDLSMGAILSNYIDALLSGEEDPIGFEDGRKTAQWKDPVDNVRGQYIQGVDF